MFELTSLLLVASGLFLIAGAPSQSKVGRDCEEIPYNSTYPLTPALKKNQEIRYRIAIVADKDKLSKVKGDDFKWNSRLKRGWLVLEDVPGKVKVKKIEWDSNELLIESDLAQKGGGMELSELKVFNGKLYTCDDKTGIVYELKEGSGTAIFFVRLNDGDGSRAKGFKCEWMTVKDQLLYVGSVGREWVNADHSVLHDHTFWVKTVDPRGLVKSHYWKDKYVAMRNSVGHRFPGYLTTEAVNWSEWKQEWFLLPRKASKQIYHEKLDEERATNKLFITKDFANFRNVDVGVFNKSRGFSSFKFLPGSRDEVFVALKTVESASDVETYIGVFSVMGETLLELQFVCKDKFEGVEFV